MRTGRCWAAAVFWTSGLLGTATPAPAGAAPGAPPRPSGAPRIEVAFALDATGSMAPYIAQARSKIRGIAAELATGSPKPEVRFALVSYRDRGDEYVTRTHAFTHDVEQMHKALDATAADGGGDEPESVLEGVREAITKLSWSPPEDERVIRLLYVIGDAPPQHYADGPTESWVSAEARRRRIVIHGIVCTSRLSEFDALARHTEGRTYELSDATPAGVVGAGAAARAEERLAGTLTSATKAYSTSIGVSFTGDDRRSMPGEPLRVPVVPKTGLLGAHVRWVRDATAWQDLWTAHTSLMPSAARPAPPAVDFTRHAVVALGGSDHGLELEAVLVQQGRRAVRVRPAAEPGVRFVLVAATTKGEG